MQKGYRKLQDMYHWISGTTTGTGTDVASTTDTPNPASVSASYPTIKCVSVLSDKLVGDNLYTYENMNNIKLALGTSCTSVLIVDVLPTTPVVV